MSLKTISDSPIQHCRVKEFFRFRGRLRRRAYWGRVACLYAVLLLAYAGLDQWVYYQANKEDYAILIMRLVLAGVFLLLIIQTVKRLHDTNLAGGWWVLLMVPIVGTVFSAALPLVDGTVGANRFGPDPKKRQPYTPPVSVDTGTTP
jgi:uncharacterized membrane protein YhaH (DUF805 family)